MALRDGPSAAVDRAQEKIGGLEGDGVQLRNQSEPVAAIGDRTRTPHHIAGGQLYDLYAHTSNNHTIRTQYTPGKAWRLSRYRTPSSLLSSRSMLAKRSPKVKGVLDSVQLSGSTPLLIGTPRAGTRAVARCRPQRVRPGSAAQLYRTDGSDADALMLLKSDRRPGGGRRVYGVLDPAMT